MHPKLDREVITAAIDGFEEQKKRINAQIAELRQMLTGGASSSADLSRATTKRRRMLATARARIAAAQRKRWAAQRTAGPESGTTSAPVRKKRKLSAAGRKAIIEATKRRWAAVRAARKR
jgi:cell division septum initiation protein DivIVA